MDRPEHQAARALVVREARFDELDELAALLGEVYGVFREQFPPDAWESYIGEIVDVRSRFEESELIVAKDRGRLSGTIAFYADASRSALEQWPAGWASIRTLGVRTYARRRGVGEALARECLRRAAAHQVSSIGLHTASYLAAATRLYERLGFRRAPEFDIEIGEMFTGQPLPLGHSWPAWAYRLDLEEVSQ